MVGGSTSVRETGYGVDAIAVCDSLKKTRSGK